MDDRERPAGIWAVAALALGLGFLGACGGLYQLGATALQEPMLAAMERAAREGGDAPPSRALQLEMQRRTLEVARDFRLPTILVEVVNLFSSIALLVAAVLLLRWHPSAPLVMGAALALAALVDLAVGGLAVAVGLETTRVLEELASASGAGSVGEGMGSVLAASGSLGVCFSAGWALAKLGAYAAAAFYLRRGAVRSLFS